MDTNQAKVFKDEAESDRDKARLNSVGMNHAGDFLNAVPVKALGLHLRPQEFTVSVKYRLGVPVHTASGPCAAECGEANADVFGDHSLGCSKESERIHRHNILRDAVHGTARQAALSPRKEESALLPGSTAKPAG